VDISTHVRIYGRAVHAAGTDRRWVGTSITLVSSPAFAALSSAFLSSRSSFLPFAASLAWRGNWGSKTLAWVEQRGSMRNRFDIGCMQGPVAPRMRERERKCERERERWREPERENKRDRERGMDRTREPTSERAGEQASERERETRARAGKTE